MLDVDVVDVVVVSGGCSARLGMTMLGVIMLACSFQAWGAYTSLKQQL
jgi:hypothetical protein